MNLSLVKKYEGLRLHAYPDPLSGGAPWTIGYGTTHMSDGRAVHQGDTITEAQADAALQAHVQDRVLPALARIPGWGEMSPNMQQALVSFAYNLGSGFYGSPDFCTLTAALRERRWHDVPAALELYCNPGTSCHEGLLRRRHEEGVLWRNGLAHLPGH